MSVSDLRPLLWTPLPLLPYMDKLALIWYVMMTNFCQMLVLYYEDMCFYADHVRRRLD